MDIKISCEAKSYLLLEKIELELKMVFLSGGGGGGSGTPTYHSVDGASLFMRPLPSRDINQAHCAHMCRRRTEKEGVWRHLVVD